jgi:tetratricopeptide (TPR) repeat protein
MVTRAEFIWRVVWLAAGLARAALWCCALLLNSARCGYSLDVAEAVRQARGFDCIAQQDGVKFEGWLNTIPEREQPQALKTVAEAYRCLLGKRVAPASYESFRQVLQERLYSKIPPDQLCIQDRLTRALIGLRQIASSQAAAGHSGLDMSALDAELNEFLAGYSASRMVGQRPDLPTNIKLSAVWCLDVANPSPPVQYTDEFIDTLVEIAAVNPVQGRHLGAVLGAVLRDARLGLTEEVGRRTSDADYQKLNAERLRGLDAAYHLLIEMDSENIAGTAHYYLFRKALAKAVPERDWAEPGQVEALLKTPDELQQRLEKWVQNLRDHANAWGPFSEYSDVLWNLAQQTNDSASERKTWRDLGRRSCEILRQGMDASEGADARDWVKLQDTLLDRVRTYGLALAAAKQYQELIDFESGYLDSSYKTLAQRQQCYIHAHLAQAYYALGDYREAMRHFESSCRISVDDLRRLAPR